MSSEKLELVKAKEALTLANDKRTSFMRQCNTCRLANVCVEYKEDSSCAFTTEVPTIKSDDDADSLMAEVIRLQTERVLHSTLVEKQEGTLHVDTDKQIELLTNLLKARQQQRASKNSIKIEGNGQGVSVLGQLISNLGRPTSSGSTQRPEARFDSKRREQQAMSDAEIADAEIIDVTPSKK